VIVEGRIVKLVSVKLLCPGVEKDKAKEFVVRNEPVTS
jgi:hypothetical protein